MQQALNEPGVDGKGLIIRGRHWLSLSSSPATYKAMQAVALSLPNYVTAFAGTNGATPAQWLAANKGSASLLSAPLPPNIHLATVHSHNASALLLRLTHVYEMGEDATLSGPVTLSLATLFAPPLTVKTATEMTLMGTQPLAGVPKTTFTSDNGTVITVPIVPAAPSGPGLTVTLTTMQIRTWIVTF